MRIEHDRVDRLFRAGVEAVESTSADLTEDGWAALACGQWTSAGVARHVLAVSRWYHDWLDRALDGDREPPFGAHELGPRNESELAALADTTGSDAVIAFRESAGHYSERVRVAWDVPFGYPFGTVTAGLHAGVAAAEWHIHASDLAGAAGRDYQPDDPEGLFLAAGLCVARAEGGVKGGVLRRLVPLGARRNPWASLLKRSGR